MAALLLILAILGIVVIVDVVIENTASSTLTLFGQDLSGLSLGEWLAVAAGLGLLIMLLLAAAGAASRRRHARKQDLRASKDEMADRVAELERENYSLRETSRRTPPAHARSDARAGERSDAPAHARSETPTGERGERSDAPEHARSDTPSDGNLWDRLTGGTRSGRGQSSDQRPDATGQQDQGARR